MRTAEQIARDPQHGDVVVLPGGKVRWRVRTFLTVPASVGAPSAQLVLADRLEEQDEGARRQEKIAIHPSTWSDLVLSAVAGGGSAS